ncbi:MAG: hypothetical protein P8Y95_05020 [Gammaproteobacteria bacterium]|jgi:glutathione synthase/RimK-type ligase-like ATP-grasp enzyme
MPTIAFLLPETFRDTGHENYELLSAAFSRAGWESRACVTDTLYLTESSVFARADDHAVDLCAADACWLMGFGRRESFLDKIQMLKLLERSTRLVNSADAYVHLHGKILLNALPPEVPTPESHLSNDADWIIERITRDDQRWVLKAPARSFGRDVFLVSREDTNLRPIVEHLTGHGERDYCLLQRYVPEAEDEKRILIAGAEVVGQYQRLRGMDHRANLATGGEPVECALSADDDRLVGALRPFLERWGVGYCAADVAGSWLLEINIVNPGGLGTLKRLGTHAPEDHAVAALTSSLLAH